jgi:hypothetical protein
VSVKCPYCDHKMRVKGAHAGRFLPTCDRCGDTFLLVIPADSDSPMLITPLDEQRRKLKLNRPSSP